MMAADLDQTAVLLRPGGLPAGPVHSYSGFDRLTRLAAGTFAVPIAAVSLTDATCQWLKSPIGLTLPMIPRDGAPCATIVRTGRPLIIPDLAANPAYRAGLLAAEGIRFYAGAPLVLPNSPGKPSASAIGALCVMSPQVRGATPAEMALLDDLAILVATQIALGHTEGRLDPVTRLPNHAQFDADLRALGQAQPGIPRVLALIDLARSDELAQIQRIVGSGCLDDLVRRAAVRLRHRLDPGTRLYHVNGTQFALLAPSGATHAELASALQHSLLPTALGSAALFCTTCTAGLATIEPGQEPAAEQLRRAQAAVDEARARRIPVGSYLHEQHSTFHRAFTLLTDFGPALAGQGGLRLAFQPRLELATNRCVGVEALLRWTHPRLGDISPGEFVPLVEKTTMTRPMMRWVLNNALDQLVTWRAAGLMLQVSVNVSPTNLEEPDFATMVVAALHARDLPHTVLELEITESVMLEDGNPALQQLQAISDAGIRIAIDDFGTGYSSLSYLQRLPADVVKIDRSFINGLSSDGADEDRRRTLVTAMIGLSHDLGYRVVAEGIETQAAADMLLTLGCDEVQGFHFGRPMPPATFQAWHAQRPWTANPDQVARLAPIPEPHAV